MLFRTIFYESPLGRILLAGDGEALTGLWFEGQRHFAATLPPDARPGEVPAFDQARRWLDLYFDGSAPDFAPPLAPAGTPFRQAVWVLLREVPFGRTVSYGALAAELAARTGKPVSARAVGGAVGRNPIALLIPCHRVIGADGGLTGYAGGLERKRALLAHEAAGSDRRRQDPHPSPKNSADP